MKTKRKISVRKILQVFVTLVVTTACIIAMISASRIEDSKTISSVAVHIKNDKKYHFIEQKEILDLAINNRNVDIEHTPLSKLDIHSMEQVIMADPWVSAAQVFIDNDKVLHLYVTQRIPVARVFQKNSVSYYLDTTLSIMPLSKSTIYYTTVITNMPELKNDSTSWLLRKDIVSLVRNIQADSFWNAQVSQVIVDSAGMYELAPTLGNQRIIFGDATRIKDKFRNLFIFYKNVLNRIGWDKYETLDLRFKGQVVASPSLPYSGPSDKAVTNMNWINSIVETEARNDMKDSVKIADTKPTHTQQKAAVPAKQIKNPVAKVKSGHKLPANAAAKKTKKPPVKKKPAAKNAKQKALLKNKNKGKNEKKTLPKHTKPDKKDH